MSLFRSFGLFSCAGQFDQEFQRRFSKCELNNTTNTLNRSGRVYDSALALSRHVRRRREMVDSIASKRNYRKIYVAAELDIRVAMLTFLFVYRDLALVLVVACHCGNCKQRMMNEPLDDDDEDDLFLEAG